MSASEAVTRAARLARRSGRRLAAGRRLIAEADLERLRLPPGESPHRIVFFDIELPFPAAEGIDWSRDYRSGRRAGSVFYGDVDVRDACAVGDLKYTWELNRHQFLVPWALAYQQTGDERHARAVVAVIADWIGASPLYVGVNWASPLELGLRLLSWGIALDVCAGSDLARGARPLFLEAVRAQALLIRRSLSAHSSANNHLVGELVGILAAAAFFPELWEASELAREARKGLLREAARQMHPDGVNREQAVYYHHYTLEYLMTALALFERVGLPSTPDLEQRIFRGVEFVHAMTDDGGEAFEIGDRDDGGVTGLNLGTGVGVYESLLRSGALLFADGRFGEHAARVARAAGREPVLDPRNAYWFGGRTAPAPRPPASRTRWFFPQGGYFVSRDEGFAMMFKAGPFGYPSIAAHAHCDQLSVCLKAGLRTVLTDCGTGVYHTDDWWRRFFRGNSAHNTVRVDGQDQALYAGPFLWATHADGSLEVVTDAEEGFEVRGHHDGYRRLTDPVRHERVVSYSRGRGYTITDRLGGRAPHRFELFWNFGPEVVLAGIADGGARGGRRANWALSVGDDLCLRLEVSADRDFRVEERRGEERLPAGFESRRYRERHPIHQVCVTALGERCEFTSALLMVRSEPVAPAVGDGVRSGREAS